MLKALFRQLKQAVAVSKSAVADALPPQPRADAAAAPLARIEALLDAAAPTVEAVLQAFDQARQLGRDDLALRLLERAAVLSPSNFAIHVNLSHLQAAAGQLDAALQSAVSAVALAPQRAETNYNLGLTYFERGEFAGAERLLRAAIALAPQFEPAHSSLICLLDRMSGIEPEAMLAQRRVWAASCIGAVPVPSHPHRRDPNRKLKVGYVSADFRGHSSAYFLLPLFRHHDPEQIEWHAYYNWPAGDATTGALKQLAHGWHNIHGLSDEAAAAQIAADRIDILIDLSGHSVGHRMGVFARRPAPLQATYMGYLGSSGLPAMDFRITDAWLDPAHRPALAQTERLVRVPRCCVSFAPDASAPALSPLPALTRNAAKGATNGATKGTITFGSLNARSKLNDAVLDLWARLLLEIPDSRLLVAAGSGGDDAVANALRQRFVRAGIAPERIDIRGRQSLAGFFALFAEIDVALDPFPYNGGTTSFHSLWMGVPVITLAGEWPLARCGLMVMENAGLPEFVAADADAYIAIARRCAADLPQLARLRAGMRRRFNAAPFADGPGLARALEETYRSLWQERCNQA